MCFFLIQTKLYLLLFLSSSIQHWYFSVVTTFLFVAVNHTCYRYIIWYAQMSHVRTKQICKRFVINLFCHRIPRVNIAKTWKNILHNIKMGYYFFFCFSFCYNASTIDDRFKSKHFRALWLIFIVIPQPRQNTLFYTIPRLNKWRT